jgi:hypothetical protein
VAHRAVGPGDLVASRFRLEDLLEEHSGARFWRATDLTLARNVALHVIAADDPRAPAVLTAARTSALVSDQHILRVLDALQEGDVVHVVHEWGSGVSLDRMLAEQPLEPRRAAWLVREVADAIRVAHHHGVAHGRLLPENVMVTDAGSVKLIGFVVDAVLHGRPHRTADGREPPSEHESDVTNLGALLYAALTGRWPGFPPSVVPPAPMDHGRTCRPRQVRQGVPRALDTLCDDILNRDHEGGAFESAGQVSAALTAYLGGTPAGVPLPETGPTALLPAGPYGAPPPATRESRRTPQDVPTAASRRDPGDPEATQADVLDARGFAATGSYSSVEDAEPTRTVPVRPGPRGPAQVTAEGEDTRAPGTGMGAGSVPPNWGPDPVNDTGAAAPVVPPEERPGSSWLRLASMIGILCLVLLAVIVGYTVGTRGGSDDATGGGAPDGSVQSLHAVPVASVVSFDPEQSGGGPADENPEQVPLATDGDPGTAWRTLRYDDGPRLAPYKAGVGLLLDLGEDTDVRDVTVTLVGSPYDVQLLAAPAGATARPTGTGGLRAVAGAEGASGKVHLAPDQAVTTRYLVVWLTALPRVDGGYQGGIAEVAVRG